MLHGTIRPRPRPRPRLAAANACFAGQRYPKANRRTAPGVDVRRLHRARRCGIGQCVVHAVQSQQPDVVVIDVDSPSRDTLEQLSMLHAHAPRPGAATPPYQPGRIGNDSQRAAAGPTDVVVGGQRFGRSCCRVRRPLWDDGGASGGLRAAHRFLHRSKVGRFAFTVSNGLRACRAGDHSPSLLARRRHAPSTVCRVAGSGLQSESALRIHTSTRKSKGMRAACAEAPNPLKASVRAKMRGQPACRRFLSNSAATGAE